MLRRHTAIDRFGRAPSATRFALAAALVGAGLAALPARAGIVGIGEEPPALAQYAADAATLQSSAVATSTFRGSLQLQSCGDFSNSQGWSCRTIVDSQDYQANRVEQSTGSSGIVSAQRTNQSFNVGGSFPAFADYSIATAEARAQTGYGSNKAEATARGATTWDETRVRDADDSDLKTEEGFVSSSIAAARSLYTEVITAATDGLVKLVFSLKLHAAQLYALAGGYGPNNAPREGDGFADLTVQVFDLDRPTTYGDGEQNPFLDSYELVAEALIQRNPSSPNGTQVFTLEFDAVAGGRYSLVSLLALEVMDNARLDLFGTASLDRIEVTSGQQLTFASGTVYQVCDPVCPSVGPDPDPGDGNGGGTVPTPGTLALSLAGALGMAVTRRRRHGAQGR